MKMLSDQLCADPARVEHSPNFLETRRRRTRPLAPRSAAAAEQAALAVARGVALFSTAKERSFPGGLFYDPAWELLVELFIADAGGHRFSVTDVCTVRGIAATTGQRYLRRLAAMGLIVRVSDPDDGRRTLLALRSKTRRTLIALLIEMGEAVASHSGDRMANADR